MRRFTTGLSVLALVVLFLVAPAHTTAEYTYLKISELITGTDVSASEEFVEIYNPSIDAVLLDGIVLQYKSASGANWQTKASLSEVIGGRSRVLIATESLFLQHGGIEMSGGFAASGGHVRIAQAIEGTEELLVHDVVGWGTANEPEQVAAQAPAKVQSLKRLFDEDGVIVDSDSNELDFFLSETPSPKNELQQVAPAEDAAGVDPEDDAEEGSNEEELPQDSAQVVTEPSVPIDGDFLPLTLTELFINPASPLTDADDEFIEILNPNEAPVNMLGYEIRVGKDLNKSYILPNTVIAPGEYVALFSLDTGIALTNTQGQAQLLSPLGKIVSETAAYTNAKDGRSWALVSDTWQWTDAPSPAKPNVVAASVDPVTGNKVRGATASAAASATAVKTAAKNAADDAERVAYEEPEQIETEQINNSVLAGVGSLAVLYAGYEYRHDFGNKIHRARTYLAHRRQNRRKAKGL